MTLTFSTGLWCFLAGLLGIALHIFAIKIPGVKQRATVANVPFSYSDYFKDDLAAIIASVLAVLVLLVILPELIAYKPEIVPFLKIGFVFVGYTGASVIVAIMGQFQTKLNGIVNTKTDISDGVVQPAVTNTPPVDSGSSAGSALPPIPPTSS